MPFIKVNGNVVWTRASEVEIFDYSDLLYVVRTSMRVEGLPGTLRWSMFGDSSKPIPLTGFSVVQVRWFNDINIKLWDVEWDIR